LRWKLSDYVITRLKNSASKMEVANYETLIYPLTRENIAHQLIASASIKSKFMAGIIIMLQTSTSFTAFQFNSTSVLIP